MLLIDFLDAFFDDSYEDFHLGIDPEKIKKLDLNELFSPIDQIHSKYSSQFASSFSPDMNLLSLYNKIGEELQKGGELDDPRLIESSHQSVLKILENFESYFILHPFFDESCYNVFKAYFEKAFKNNVDVLESILEDHKQVKSKIPIQEKFNLLNITTTIQNYYDNLGDNLSVKEAFKRTNYIIYEKYKSASKRKRRKYLDDWILKSSQLIENYHKKSLLTLSRVIDFDDLEKQKKYENLPERPSLGEVYWLISKDYPNRKNVEKFRIMRNAIDHSGEEIIYNDVSEEFLVYFKEKEKDETRSSEGLVTDYFKLLKFNFTFEIITLYYDAKINCRDGSLPEKFKEAYLTLTKTSNQAYKNLPLKERFKLFKWMIVNVFHALTGKKRL